MLRSQLSKIPFKISNTKVFILLRNFNKLQIRLNKEPDNQKTNKSSDKPSLIQKYIKQFKKKPGNYLTSFLILHEISAIIPLILFYLIFNNFDFLPEIKLEQDSILKIEKWLSKWSNRITGQDLNLNSKAPIYLACSYALVKLMLPIRLAASAYFTPWFSKKCITPIISIFKK